MSDERHGSARLLAQPPGHAEVGDCMAHRCAKHVGFDDLVDRSGPDGSECSICVAQTVVNDFVRQFVIELLTPILVAYEHAEGALHLLGAHQNPRIAALIAILEALGRKAEDRDFNVELEAVHVTPPGKVN